MSDAIRTAHHYHDWVFSSFADHLRSGSALEVGSGHGKYSRKLAGRLDHLYVSDIDPRAVEAISSELSDLGNVTCITMTGIEPAAMPVSAVDNVVLVNLLEHIEDDRGMLGDCCDILRPQGRLLLFVPAFPALFSVMDDEAGHHRRYRRAALRRLVEAAGFRVVTDRMFNAVGFFGWYANKLLGSNVNSGTTNAQVGLYNQLIPVLKHADRLLPFVGQSIVLVGEKRS
ncbi:MAG: class I SAM-dependent methyltransferase [Myxococcota bacterium]